MISASILASDLSCLREEIARVSPYIDMIHLDVMDGVFVPNITFGLPLLKAVRKCTDLPIDSHLMIIEPDRYIDKFIDLGSSIITVHYETCPHLNRTINKIREKGASPYVAINPHTPVDMLKEIVYDVDGVLLMTVNPGFSGQKFIESSYDKIRSMKEMIQQRNPKAKIMVDGGIDKNNIKRVMHSGAEILVMGYGVFKTGDLATLRKEMEDAK